LKAAIERARHGLAQGGFSHAGHAFNQQVAARQDADQGQPDDFVLAANHLAERGFQIDSAMGQGRGGLRRHSQNSTMGGTAGRGYRGDESYQLSAISTQHSALSTQLSAISRYTFLFQQCPTRLNAER